MTQVTHIDYPDRMWSHALNVGGTSLTFRHGRTNFNWFIVGKNIQEIQQIWIENMQLIAYIFLEEGEESICTFQVDLYKEEDKIAQGTWPMLIARCRKLESYPMANKSVLRYD